MGAGTGRLKYMVQQPYRQAGIIRSRMTSLRFALIVACRVKLSITNLNHRRGGDDFYLPAQLLHGGRIGAAVGDQQVDVAPVRVLDNRIR